MVTVNFETLYRAYPVFMDLLEQKLPVNTALKIRKLIMDLNSSYEEITKIQDAVISIYAQKDSDDIYHIPEEVESAYLEEMQNRLQKEIDVEWEEISTNDLGKFANLTIKELETVSFLFNDTKPATV